MKLLEELKVYNYKEKKHFGYYSRDSLFETKTWLTKAHNRKLITADDFQSFINNIDFIGKMLNNYIKSIGKQPMTNNQ